MSYIYLILIKPIEYLLGVICYILYDVFNSESIVIICLAVFVSVFTTPLYRAADEKSRIQREQKKELVYWEKRIKRTFAGEEKFARLNTYYRQKKHNIAFSTIREILPLLLQIPFFMAAYNYLLDSSLLENADIFMLDDLNRPDGLIKLFGWNINILPIIMTSINLISSYVYLKDRSLREKLQSITLALAFFIILYRSPAGLLVYWITNNLYSLFRNLIDRYVNDKRRIAVFLSSLPIIVLSLWVVVIIGSTELLVKYAVVFVMLLLFPLYMAYKNWGLKKNRIIIKKKVDIIADATRSIWCELIITEVLIVLLLGAMIPLNVICASPKDFIHIYNFYDPLEYVIGNIGLYAGLCLWISFFSAVLFDKTRLEIISVIMNAAAVFAMIQYIFFGGGYGLISEEFVYDSLTITGNEKMISCLVFVAVLGICIAGIKYKKVKNIIMRGAVLSALIFVVIKWDSGRKEIVRISKLDTENTEYNADLEPVYKLSKTGQNVMVIMLDRAIGAMLPYVMEEKPELKEELRGFTYYPNTVSFGARTNRTVPSLFGGYEYSPENINKRTDKTVKEKCNEALHVLPDIFYANGYEVAVSDMPFMNNSDFPGMESYNKGDGMHGYILEGRYTSLIESNDPKKKRDMQQRRFFMYSLFRTVPGPLAETIYSRGEYLQYSGEYEDVRERFIDAYMVLEVLPEITVVSNDIPGQFIMFDNNATHEPCYLQMPDYLPNETVSNDAYEKNIKTDIDGKIMKFETKAQKQCFEINVAALLKLGEYFDYMRACGVYDNTRIIIVADHGEPIAQFDDMLFMNGELDAETLNPLFMFKDFYSDEFTVSNEFMTNADMPTLALKGIVDEPVNPYTGNPITDEYKKGKILVSDGLSVDFPEGYAYDSGGGKWYYVKDSIFEEENWSKADYE